MDLPHESAKLQLAYQTLRTKAFTYLARAPGERFVLVDDFDTIPGSVIVLTVLHDEIGVAVQARDEYDRDEWIDALTGYA